MTRSIEQDKPETPRVGNDVHFVGLDTDGPCEAAKITRVSNPAIICALVVFHWSEITFETAVPHDHNRSRRSWHWPHQCVTKDEAADTLRSLTRNTPLVP